MLSKTTRTEIFKSIGKIIEKKKMIKIDDYCKTVVVQGILKGEVIDVYVKQVH